VFLLSLLATAFQLDVFPLALQLYVFPLTLQVTALQLDVFQPQMQFVNLLIFLELLLVC
jgi:hypothetical protein